MAHEKFSRKFPGRVVTVHRWHQLALEQHLPSPGSAFSNEWLWSPCLRPIECTSHDVCTVSPLQDCCRNFSFACGMEKRNEAASNHASLLTCSFLFRALARLQPPAGLIETAMERERDCDVGFHLNFLEFVCMFTYFTGVPRMQLDLSFFCIAFCVTSLCSHEQISIWVSWVFLEICDDTIYKNSLWLRDP